MANLEYNPITGKLDLVSETYFVENGDTIELWWNGSIVQSWTKALPTGGAGVPIGLLLSLTYSS